MCYYSVSVKARKDQAHSGEELTLVHFPSTGTAGQLGHKGFASLEDPGLPVCVVPNTNLRYLGLDEQLAQSLGVPTEGEARFETRASHGYEDSDQLVFPNGRSLSLADLKAGLQIRIISVPASKQQELQLEETPVPVAEPVAVGAR